MIETAITELTKALNRHADTLDATNTLLKAVLSALPETASTVAAAPVQVTAPAESEAPKPAATRKPKAAAAPAPAPAPEPTPEPEVEAAAPEQEPEAQPEEEKKKTPDQLRSEIRSEYSRNAGPLQYKEFFRSTVKTHGGVDASTATGISVQKIPEASLEACLADLQSYVA